MQKFTLTLSGTAPLLMCNGRMADPLDPAVKALKPYTGKSRKTDEDHATISRLEFLGNLYLDPDVGPYIPGENIQKCLIEAARFDKLGKNVERGLLIETEVNPIAYSGPRQADKLAGDANFVFRKMVKISGRKTARTRPRFLEWRTEASGVLDTTQLNVDSLRNIAFNAGALIGLGDWRPRYGRFVAEVHT